MVNQMYKFMKDNDETLKKIPFHDQAIINAVCYNKIGILPAKIGTFNFNGIKELELTKKTLHYDLKPSAEMTADVILNPGEFYEYKITQN